MNNWDVQIADKLRGLSLESIKVLLDIFNTNKVSVADLDKKIATDLLALGLVKKEDKDYVYIKGSISHNDYYDLIDYRDERNERLVRDRIKKERLQANG